MHVCVFSYLLMHVFDHSDVDAFYATQKLEALTLWQATTMQKPSCSQEKLLKTCAHHVRLQEHRVSSDAAHELLQQKPRRECLNEMH